MGESKTKCVCTECGNEFYVYNALIRRDGKRLFCNIECRSKAWKGKGNPRYKKDEGWTKCKFCKKDYKVKPSALKANKHRQYCSKKCQQEYRDNTRVKLNCAECGEEFVRYKSWAKRTNIENQCCSMSCSSTHTYRKMGAVNYNKGVQRGKGGKRSDLDGLYVRSSWEANYARYLNFLVQHKEIATWEYEPDTFEFHKIKRGAKFYTPDFKIINNDGSLEYHEVKGWMDQKSKTKLKRMAKYYPEINIKIIDQKWFRSNQKQLSGLIEHWE